MFINHIHVNDQVQAYLIHNVHCSLINGHKNPIITRSMYHVVRVLLEHDYSIVSDLVQTGSTLL